jgi:predicted short-subunit dehydrogenase-like oxidoreductase (DUF2520 family)
MRELERDLPDRGGPSTAAVAMPLLAVIGAGRAGKSFARAADRAGLEATVAGRNGAAEACGEAEVALLCVPDGEIEAAAIAAAECVPPLRFVGHVSGAVGLEGLRPAGERGAGMFGVHPLQTLPDGNADLDGAACAVNGSDAASLQLATRLAEQLGMRPFAISDEQRAVYHAAASMASNFLVALEESAAELLAAAGLGEPRELLAPLILRSAANWSERGRDALTGPIARGDEATVEMHRTAIADVAPALLPLYDELAARTRALSTESEPGR